MFIIRFSKNLFDSILNIYYPISIIILLLIYFNVEKNIMKEKIFQISWEDQYQNSSQLFPLSFKNTYEIP